jgi:energy-coupling factor transport system ATP-binding protein
VISAHENLLPDLVSHHVKLGEMPQTGLTHRSPLSRAGGEVCIAAKGLSFTSNDQPLFSGIDLTVHAGAWALIFGENGSGKSTLVKCLLGALTPSSGDTKVCGVTNPTPAQLVGKVGYLMQNPERQLFEEQVDAEIAFTLVRQHVPREQIREKTAATIALFGLQDLAGRNPFTLSYGQKHLVALASLIAPEPEVLFLDEPFTGLDPSVQASILEVIGHCNQRRGATIVMTSHREERSWGSSHYCLDGGVLREA